MMSCNVPYMHRKLTTMLNGLEAQTLGFYLQMYTIYTVEKGLFPSCLHLWEEKMSPPLPVFWFWQSCRVSVALI